MGTVQVRSLDQPGWRWSNDVKPIAFSPAMADYAKPG
jgi:hypothetical protein